MNPFQQNEKNISKIFTFLRTQLQSKEKELLELQRADPCLSGPDSDQIDMLVNAIASLQLSTEEGSFVFASTNISDDSSSIKSVCSNGFNSIKTLPSTIWLSQSNPIKQQNQQRSSIFNHLLSLPINAYLASSSETSIKTQNKSLNRIPMVNHLLFMPIDAFKSSSNLSTSLENKNKKHLQNNMSLTTKSILNSEVIYSKEYWLQTKPKSIACT